MSTTAVDAIRDGTDPKCHADICEDSGCSLSMSGAPSPGALISLEHPAAPVEVGRPRCDFLFVGGRDEDHPLVAPIELTTGKKRASEFLKQIRGGASVADRLLPPGVAFRFRPVAAHRRGLAREEVRKLRLRANRVAFRGQYMAIKPVRCGSNLARALDA